MKNLWMSFLGILLLAAQAGAEDAIVLKTRQDKANYATGVEIIRSLRQQGGVIDLDLLIQGMRDGLTGNGLLLSENELAVIKAQASLEDTQHRAAARQDELPNRNSGQAIEIVNDGPANVPATRQPQSPSRRDVAVTPLASAGPAVGTDGAAVAAQSVNPVVAQRESAQTALAAQAEQQGRTAPDGTILSRRNQALMQVQQLKAQRGSGM